MKVDKIIALIKERVGSNYELPGWKSHRKMSVIPINSITEKAFIPVSYTHLTLPTTLTV